MGNFMPFLTYGLLRFFLKKKCTPGESFLVSPLDRDESLVVSIDMKMPYYLATSELARQNL